jgi:hypothetical protein
MKATLNFVVVVLLLGTFAYSASAQEKETRVRNKEGNFAVGFDLGGFGTFNVNDGPNQPTYSISARQFISDNLALIAGVGYNSSSDLTDTTGRSDSYYSVSVGVQKHWPLYTHNTSFYGQFALGYGGGSTTTTQTPDIANSGGQDPQAVTASQTKSSNSVFSAGISAGFDWYIWDGIALGTSYGLYFVSIGSSTETSTGTTDSPSSSSIGISTQGAVHMLIAF